ncbi:ABL1 [Branchiostoma lanceolatum]|uniref:non-specific protein-tyrosine kinase n=1 Tax=Branchiostoma lanceolatum TaxID=7740 RepID=A0A8J9YZ48_BRALA|nr:ABL1 [Branchiostoma lanceolatum]
MLVRFIEDKDCPRELRTLAAIGNSVDANPRVYMYYDPAEVEPVYQGTSKPSGEGLLCLASFWSNQHLKKIPGYHTAQPLINKECRELVYCDIPEIANAVSRRLLVKGNCLEVERLVTEVQPKRIQSLHSTKGLELEQRDPLHICNNSVMYHGTMSGNHHVVVKAPKIQKLESLQCTEGTYSVNRIKHEILVSRHLHHENIMPISGYVLAVPPVHYITEFMHYGNLRQHLCDNRRVIWPAQQLLCIATDILKALIFLESRSIVHRNVRARKVLIGQSGTRMAVKLTGFELAREVKQNLSHYHFNMYTGTREEEVPLRWLAVESLAFCRYSVKSEIWMYAVLLYEIFTMGCVPWQEFAARPFDEVLQNIVHRNLRMKRPPCIPNAVFQVILKSMNVEDRSRPSYSTLAEELGCLHDRYSETSDVIYGEHLTAPPPIDESINVAHTSPIPTINPPQGMFGDGVSGSEIEDSEDELYVEVGSFGNTAQEENVYEDVDARDMMLVSSVTAADQPKPHQEENLFTEVSRYKERKARTLKDLRREMKDQNSTLRMVDLRKSTQEGSITVVTEGTTMGSLEDYLIKKKDVDPTQYALPIATALQAMHSKGFVHSDLRLGHVFLDTSPHGTHEVQIKLGRLSRVKKLQLGVYDMDLAESMFQDKDGCPIDAIRWSPAEVIQSGTYSFASDVYSLGVVFWQMYVSCHVPYEQGYVRLIPHQRLKNDQVLQFLEASPFLRKPPCCPDFIDHGKRLLGTWSKTCDPPDLSGIYDVPNEGNSMDSVLSDRSQMEHGHSAYRNVQLPPGLMKELSGAIKQPVQAARHFSTPKSPLAHETDQEDIYEDIDQTDEESVQNDIPPDRSDQVTVVWSYSPQDNLRLSVGDVLTHLEEVGVGSGWWKGSCARGRGVFLAAYVKFFDAETEVVNPDLQLNADLQARVILDYTPDDELTIVAGERVTVGESTSDEEAWIRVTSSRGEGYVPRSCLAITSTDTTVCWTECNIDSDTDRLMVSMADPGRLRVEYTKSDQVKKSMDQCLEADIAALSVTEEERDYYHPLAYGWTICSIKKTQGAEDFTFVDWKSGAADPTFPAAVETATDSIIYGPRKPNGEEDGRLVLVCMSPLYGRKAVRHEWYRGGDLVCEGVDMCLLYATEPAEYRCHIISCRDGQEIAMSETVKVVRTSRVPEDLLILPSALRVMEDPIGQGGCGTVFKARLRRHTQMAAKKLQGCSFDDFGSNNEIEILRKLHHPNIVSFLGVCFRESVIIVTELVNGYDLRKAIIDKMKFPSGCQGYIAYQLCQALDYIHHMMIVHQDVKPSNVLIAIHYS